MPVIKTKGAASSQGFGEFAKASGPANYIEDVFSTYLYTGTAFGVSQTVTNGINLSTKGGMVWCKSRGAVYQHYLFDTARGTSKYLISNSTDAQSSGSSLSSFNVDGFTLDGGLDGLSNSSTSFGSPYVSWTFRKQPKFFDVVTWTGDDTGPRNIAHNLGSAPACMLIKVTNTTGNWFVYHSGLNAGTTPEQYYITLNSTSSQTYTGSALWNGTAPTASVFSIGNAINTSPNTYVAYLFASNAGGFGLTGSDNVITCGSMTTSSLTGKAAVNLGYEPQFVITKSTDAAGNWIINDTMRGMPTIDSSTAQLYANLTNAEASGTTGTTIDSTGFSYNSNIGGTAYNYIYIAIRRGPMKVPTLGTAVFGTSARSGTNVNATVTGGQTDDAVLIKNRGSAVGDLFAARLTGTGYLETSSTAAEVAAGTTILQANPWDVMDGVKVGTTSTITNASANTYINYLFKRAPSFFDVVCYTGTGTSAKQITHNLGISPNLIIVKKRSASGTDWVVYCSSLANYSSLILDLTDAATVGSSPPYNIFGTNAQQTSTYITLGGSANIGYYNTSGSTYIAYLFATCSGVSKVGSYTGNGSTQTIDCGFGAGGARFVMLKRTDAAGDWYTYDTARGMTTLTDPYFLMDTSAAEVATLGSVTTVSTGFALNSTILAAINVNAGTYIFLAIA